MKPEETALERLREYIKQFEFNDGKELMCPLSPLEDLINSALAEGLSKDEILPSNDERKSWYLDYKRYGTENMVNNPDVLFDTFNTWIDNKVADNINNQLTKRKI